MPTKIRLQRHGKKGSAFFHIVIADGRAPRDGKFIEKLGTYNPTTNPATIDIDLDRALYWLQTGAQPTETCRAILGYRGVLYKNHLQRGVTKGALTQEQADAKYEKWIAEKGNKINSKIENLSKSQSDAEKARLAAEAASKEAKAAKIAAKNTPAPAAEETEAAAPAAEEGSTEA
jgi:small subunit ribosomal protein S16